MKILMSFKMKALTKYLINNTLEGLTEIEVKKNSAFSEERNIANAILEWHKNANFSFHTSGSTGTPKEIQFTKEQIIASINQSKDAFDLTSNDTALLSLPIRYVAGKMMLYRALHLGINLITTDPKTDLAKIIGQPISFAAFIPIQVENILSTEEGSKWFSKIRIVLIGGAPINPKLEEELKSFKNNIYHTYGMTETLTHIAIKKLSQNGELFYSALPYINLSKSNTGTLHIEATHLGVSVETNDMVEFQDNGKFRILGRKDHVINSGALKIFPEEIETILKKYIDNDLVIIGKKDETLGQKVVLCIEGEKGKDPEWLSEGIAQINKNKRPKEIHYLTEFPRTDSGKIQRNELEKLL